MEELRNYILSIVKTTEEDLDIFLDFFEPVEFSKNQVVVEYDQVERYLYFLNEGITRFYIRSERNGIPTEKTFAFAFAFSGWFSCAYESFITQKPSKYFVEAMTDIKGLKISYNNLQVVYEKMMVGQQIGRLMSEFLFLRKSAREYTLLTETAEERYMHLLQHSPHYIQLIPLKFLASYIGITPAALSRIRARI